MDVRKQILDYIKEEYESTGEVPSLSAICRIEGVYKEKFYRLFPNGITEASRLAGVPSPEERLESTKSATSARETPPPRASEETQPILRLTPEQTRRVYGLSHIEGSLDPSLIIDSILKRDEELRRAGVGFKETQKVLDFIGELEKRGWESEGLLGFLDSVAARILLPMLTPEQGQELLEFLMLPNPGNLTLGERVEELALGLRVKRLWEMKEKGELTRTQLLEALAR